MIILDIDNNKDLDQILKIIRANPIGIWHKNQKFATNNQEIFQLKNTIIFSSDDNVYRVVSNTPLIDQTNSRILPVEKHFHIKTIIDNTHTNTKKQQIVFINHDKELVKMFKFADQIKDIIKKDKNKLFLPEKYLEKSAKKTCETIFLNEYKQSRPIKHLGVRAPCYKSKTDGYMLMRNLPGVDLLTFLNTIQEHQITLPATFILALSHAIVTGIHNQVTRYKYVHLDIKPENIMLDLGEKHNNFLIERKLKDLNPNHVFINCIDYAFSKEMYAKNYPLGICGTDEYISPEVLNQQFADQKEKPDVYAAGIILQILWGLDLMKHLDSTRTLTSTTFDKIYRHINNIRISGLSKELYSNLCILTINMVKTNPNKRYDLTQAIKILECIIDKFIKNPNLIYVASTGYEKTVEKFVPSPAQNSLKNPSGEDRFAREQVCTSLHDILKALQNIKPTNNNQEPPTSTNTDYKKYEISKTSSVAYNKFDSFFAKQLEEPIQEFQQIAQQIAKYPETYVPQSKCLKNRSGNIWPFWGEANQNRANQVAISCDNQLFKTIIV